MTCPYLPAARWSALWAASAIALAAPSFSQCGEDGFEENDSCATAVPITTPFTANGLAVYRIDPDYFQVNIPPGEEVEISVWFSHATADVDVYLFDRNSACGGFTNFLSRAITSTDNEFITWRNTGSSTIDAAIRVEVFPGSLDPCNTYDITIDVAPPFDPCNPALHEDGLEDNDSCSEAILLPLGLTPDLWATRDDEDFYRVTLAPGATMDAQIYFVHSETDLDLFLYDANGACGGSFMSGELASGFSQTDDERIVWSNTSGLPMEVILHVDVWNADNCNDYNLDVAISGNGIGSNYCNATPNSTGLIGLMRASGTTSVAANSITLRAEQLPRGSAAFFLNSLTQGFVPNAGGSQGSLCLGGEVGRYDDDILNAGLSGTVSLAIDLNAVPQPTGFVSASAGQTWHFQAWHRDLVAGSVTSNLTNGLQITLMP